MRNFNFNWMKNAAKNTQTTGGGTSRRCEDANQSRIASDPIPCRYRVDTVSLPCFGYTPGISGRLMKYAAMITLLLTLACGNVWGAVTSTSLCPASDLNPSQGIMNAFYSADANIDDSVYVGRAGGSTNIYTASGVSKANSIVFKLKNTTKVYFTLYNNNGKSKTTTAHFVSINENDYKAIKLARNEAPSTRISTTVNAWSSSADATKKGIYDYLKAKYASFSGSNANTEKVMLGFTITDGISAAYGTSSPTDSTLISITSNKTETRYFVFGDPTTYTTTASALNSPKATLPAGCYILEIYSTTDNVGITAITTEAVASCSAPTASWSTAPADGTAGGNMNASLTTNYAAGVVYTSSNTDVATVSGNGTTTCAINYVAAGTARITATVTGDGSTICVGPATCYTDITVTSAGSGWGIASSDNSWTASADEMSGSGTVTKTLSLSANADLQFKIVDISGNTWYGNGEIWGGTKTQSVSSTGTENNCHLLTTEAGSYTFSFNTSTKDLTITYPNSYTFYYANSSSWSNVYVYKFTSNGSTGNNATWPGVKIATPSYTCGGTDYYAATSDGYSQLIFTDNSSQTGDMVVAAADDGKYVGGTGNSWSAFPTYSVTYNANGDGAGNATGTTGSVPTDSNSPYACGSTVTVLGKNTLAKSGYTFTGWNTAPGGGGTSYAEDATFTISANTTLYAQWEQDKYTVTYNVNGGGSVTPTSATQATGGASLTLPTPTWSGYTFDGWYNAGTKIGNGGASYTPTADITLYAHWTDNISGKLFSYIDGHYGDKYKSFDGTWVTADATGKDKTFTNAAGVQFVIDDGCWDKKTGLVSLFAKHKVGTSSMEIIIPTGKIATVKIIYGAYGTDADSYSLTVNGVQQAGPASNKLTDGMTSIDGKTYEVTLTNQTGTLTLSSKGGSGKNLYIVRVSAVITGYVVTYDKGTYGTGTLAAGTKTHGSNFTLSSSDDSFTRDGYVYDGWSTNADGSTKDYNLGGTYSTDAAITLYPHWVASCTAPSALAAATPTAKGITLSVTDANNVNNYEFYVSTSSTAPEAGATATHSVSSAKSLTITNLVAGTTYYAWARSVCGVSNKSGWTALTDDTFETSTVSADYHPTNVTKTAGATSGIGGSNFTATFSANTDYSLPSTITVTIGGNSATSGTDYTWSDGTLTIPASKINGDIDITVNSAPAAPSSVNISGAYLFFPGETISLTATPTGGNGPTTYQWQKKINGDWTDITLVENATAQSANFQIASATTSNTGNYRCVVTKGGTQSLASDQFDMKCLQLYTYYNDKTTDYGNWAFERVDETHASLSVYFNLGGDYVFTFKVTDGLNNWYGNTGTMTGANNGPWTLDVNSACGVTVGKAATYVFKLDFSAGIGNSMTMKVDYPSADQAAGKVIYLDNSVLTWSGSSIYYRIGHNTYNTNQQLTLVPGTTSLYRMKTSEFNGFAAWHIGNAAGQTGSSQSIYNTKNGTAITAATEFEGGAVSDTVTVTPVSAGSYTGGDSQNNNCTFYKYGITSKMKTQTVTISPYSNGTITVNYVDTGNVARSFTSGSMALPHTVVLTSITAVPASGYEIDDALTINGDGYEANYVVTGATTVAASFKPATYTVTLNTNSGTINAGNVTSYTYLTGATLPTNVTRDGYRFMGWYATSDFSTDRVYTIGTSEYGNKEYWAKWAQLYTITNAEPANGTITVVASAIAGETVDISAAASSGYVFDEWNIYKTGTPATTVSPATATASTSFTMPAYGVTVDASFVVQTYALSYSIGTGATCAASGGTAAGSYAEGTTITVPAQGTLANTGYTFRGWTDGTTFYLAGQTFSMPAADVELAAVWDESAAGSCELVNIDFTDETTVSLSTTDTKTVDGVSVYFKGFTSITNGTGAIPYGNMSSNANYLAIPISGINGSISFTVTGETRPQLKYYILQYDALPGAITDPGNTTEISRPGSGSSVTVSDVSVSKSYAVLYLGRKSATNQIGTVSVTTPCTVSSNFTVSFANQTGFGGSTTLPDDIVGVPTGKKVLQPSNPTAAGYTFGGWYSNAACTAGNEINWNTLTISADKAIYAKWTANSYTINYYDKGGSAFSGDHADGYPTSHTYGTATNLKEATKSCYTFGGWYTATDCSTGLVTSLGATDYTAAINLYAKWTLTLDVTTEPDAAKAATVGEACSISMAATGASGFQWQTCTDATPSSSSDISSGSQYANYTTNTLSFTPPTAGTYYFRCKITDACSNVDYTSVVTVTASVAKTDPTVYELSGTTSVCEGDDATITLDGSDDGVTYALYLDGVDQSDDKVGDGNAITWTVTADGTYTVSAKADATYNSADMDGSAVISYKTATAINTPPTAAVNGYDGVDFTLGSDLAATGEGTLTYQWYSYTSSGGAGQATVGSATTTKTLTTSKAVGTYYYKVEVIGECERVKSDMITVTVDNKHRITYDANNGSGAPSGNWKSPGAMTLPTDLPTRSGYIFLGWNTKDDGTGDMYQPGGSFTMPATATTLWAAWASPCFTFSKGTKGTEPTDGFVMTPSNINSSAFKGGATLSGGNMTNTSGATLGINGTYGFVMIKSTRELTLTLSGGQFQEGTVIELEGYTNSNSTVHTYGFSVSGNAATPLKTATASSYDTYKQRYVVTASDGVEGEESCTITMNADASGSQTYLSAIKIGGCMACTSINPTLTYSKTTIWMDDESLTASPTLNKDGSTGSATYVSNNTDVATVNESTGVVTAVARGTATITATIAADGTHCGKTATCDITVKSADCGYTEVAKLTRTSGSKGTISGPLAGNYGVNTQSDGKLGSNGHYMYLVLSSGHYYADGDSVYVTINKINDQGSYLTIRAGGKVPGADLAQLAKASLVVGANNGLRLSNVPANTDTITIYRKDGSDQNHQLDAITVKRYGCPDVYVFDAADSGLWSDEDNWIGAAGHGSGLPTIDDRAIITKPITVDIAHATASEVRLDKSSTNTGSLTIQANKGLEVAGKVQVWNGSALSATTPSDLLLESSSAGNATLIFNNSNNCQATVQMYSKGWTTGEQGGGTWNWQTVGVPVTDATRMNDYYGGYMYEWSSGWVDKTDMYGALTPFTAYSVSYPTGDEEHLHTYSIDGTLVPTGDKSISIPANTSVMALANSWTAPIHISDIEFTSEPANIFLYNTGYNYESAATKADSRYAPGTYLCIPKNSAPYLDESYIAPMQGFYVKNKLSSAGTITINYNTVVRPSSDRAIVSGAMHAPKRTMSNLSEPAVLKMYVSDSQHDDRLVLLEREDFSRGFDNGWDGEKFQINAVKTAPRIFAINETGGKESVSAIPELENTVIGFRPGKEETYTIRFEYNGDETLYLRDTRIGAETLITNESEYVFLSDGTNEDARFIIVRVQSTPTGVEETGAGSKAYKLMIEDHIYIIRDGRMYSVDGALVNLERK